MAVTKPLEIVGLTRKNEPLKSKAARQKCFGGLLFSIYAILDSNGFKQLKPL
jgi:hypothetical protein